MSELHYQSASSLLPGIGWLLAQVMGMNGVPGSRAFRSPSGKPGFVLSMPEQGYKKVAEAHKASRGLALELVHCCFCYILSAKASLSSDGEGGEIGSTVCGRSCRVVW